MVYLTELFPTTIAASIFVVVYALWLFSELVVGGIIPRSRRCGAPIRYEDKSSRPLIALSTFLSPTIAFLFASSGIASLPSGAFYLGINLDDRRHSSSTVVDCRAGALFLADRRRSRGSGGGGPGALSTGAPSRVYRIAPHDRRDGVRAAVVGGCARDNSFFRRGFRLSDSRGGGGFNIEAEAMNTSRTRREQNGLFRTFSEPFAQPLFFFLKCRN